MFATQVGGIINAAIVIKIITAINISINKKNNKPGEYSCLLMELTLRREFSYYMLTIYVPTCMLVIVSW